MANEKKPYRWRAHLDDFQMDAAGRYVYTGKRYTFDGSDRERSVYLVKLVAFGLLALLSTVIPECLPPVGVSRTPLTLVPWALQLIAVAATGWAVARLFAHATELRAYVYRATARSLPVKSAVTAVLSAVTLICQTVFLLTRGFSPDGLTAARLIGSALSCGAATLLFFASRAGRWREIP